MTHASLGNVEQATASAEKAYSLAPWMIVNIATLAAMLNRTGDLSRSEELLRRLLPGDAYGAPLGLAHYYLHCGDLDTAVHWTEKAIEQRQPAAVFFLNVHAEYFRSGSRWSHLAKLLNLPQGT